MGKKKNKVDDDEIIEDEDLLGGDEDEDEDEDLLGGDEDEDEDEDDGGLIVDLDEEDEDDDDEDPALAKKKQNKKFAQMRVKLKEKEAEIERLSRSAAAPYTPAPQRPAAAPQGANDPNNPRNWSEEKWDEYAKKDWKGAIDLRTQINAENIITQTNKEKTESTILATSKKTVEEKHPELMQDNSEKTKVYLQILEENPRYLTDPKGPIHAMRDMEDRMRELGYPEEQIVAAEKRGIQKEKKRQSTVQLTSQKGRHTQTKSRKVQLTKDDLEFCKYNEIDPKEYAKNKLRVSKNKGELQV